MLEHQQLMFYTMSKYIQIVLQYLSIVRQARFLWVPKLKHRIQERQKRHESFMDVVG